MPTEPGKVQNFQNVSLVIDPGAHRVDAFDDAGINLAWQGDAIVVKVGPDLIPVYVATGLAHAIVTVTLLPASNSIDFIAVWVASGLPKAVSLIDANGRTFLTDAKSMPRQRGNMQFNATLNPVAFDIICPNMQGLQGGLNT